MRQRLRIGLPLPPLVPELPAVVGVVTAAHPLVAHAIGEDAVIRAVEEDSRY